MFVADCQAPYQLINISSITYVEGIQYSYYKFIKNTHQQFQKAEDFPLAACNLVKIPLPQPTVISEGKFKNKSDSVAAWEAFHKMGAPRYVCAPMVDQSELAFRMMVRHYGAQLCYTPMILADLFNTSKEYRKEAFITCDEDHPLVVQFAANNPEVFLQAAKRVMSHCEAIDLNLGCPQPIAKRHYYGAWLMENWELVYALVSRIKENLQIPIWCKIRIFDDVELTVKYAKMIESAGASLLTVHGRKRSSRMNLEKADWSQIKAVKENLNIPVYSNGNIHFFEDIQSNLSYTKADGVLSADALLSNPLLFSGKKEDCRKVGLEYLDYAIRYQAHLRYVIPHILQIICSKAPSELLQVISVAKSVDELIFILKNCDLSAIERPRSSNYSLLVESNNKDSEKT